MTCDDELAQFLINTSRPFIFSTAPPPPAVAGRARGARRCSPRATGSSTRLAANSAAIRDELAREGFDVSGSTTQIVPLVIGEADLAMRICELAIEHGVFAQAIRPPTVAEGTSRLRLAVMATHTQGGAARGRPRARPRRAAGGLPARRRRARRRRARRLAPPRRGVNGCLVTGTDTGVGKTVVAAAIVAALRARGLRVAPVKPVVTGLDEPEPGRPPDHELLAAAAGLDDPARGHAADVRARRSRRTSPQSSAGVTVEPAELVAAARAAPPTAPTCVVGEGVGGLLVPLTGGYLIRDYALDLGLPLVIAARPGLGTINHTLLTIESARAAGLARRSASSSRRGRTSRTRCSESNRDDDRARSATSRSRRCRSCGVGDRRARGGRARRCRSTRWLAPLEPSRNAASSGRVGARA